MRLYQAEWCPFSHRVRAKLTELGVDYEVINVSASAMHRDKLEEVAGTKAIPVLVDGDRVISDSDEAISYLEQKYRMDPEELKLHRRELSPTVYGTLPFGVEEATERLREALQEDSIEVLEELDLSPFWERGEPYKVLIAIDPEFVRLATEKDAGAATLALIKIAVYDEDGLTRVDAIEPEKVVGQIRDPELNDQGLELRKRFIKMIKALERSSAKAG
jgi:glutaredoxin 3